MYTANGYTPRDYNCLHVDARAPPEESFNAKSLIGRRDAVLRLARASCVRARIIADN